MGLRDLVIEAKKMGFLIVNVVTNGTFPIDLPEADLILLSLDGDRERHNEIRGDTYDTIMENIKKATADNICFYMAVNQMNQGAIRDVCQTAKDTPHVRAVSFNFPTPCHQCVVIENGKVSTCGRCIEVPGLCEQCGYFFVAEYTLLFHGNIKIILEMLRTYLKYI